MVKRKKTSLMDKPLVVRIDQHTYEQLEKQALKLSKEFGIKIDVSKVVRRLLDTHPDLKR